MLIQESLEKLKQEVREMAQESIVIFDMAIKTMHSRDEMMLADVRSLDKKIDDMEMKLDKHCMEILLKEPYAIDFRYVFSSVKTISELERIGDQSKTVAKWSIKLDKISPDMVKLELKTREALTTAIKALVDWDAEVAAKVMELEFQVDELEDAIINSSTDIAEAFIAKALERIGDIATNIAENVIFSVSARDIRHGKFQNS